MAYKKKLEIDLRKSNALTGNVSCELLYRGTSIGTLYNKESQRALERFKFRPNPYGDALGLYFMTGRVSNHILYEVQRVIQDYMLREPAKEGARIKPHFYPANGMHFCKLGPHIGAGTTWREAWEDFNRSPGEIQRITAELAREQVRKKFLVDEPIKHRPLEPTPNPIAWIPAGFPIKA